MNSEDLIVRLADGIRSRDRRALARAITLAESTRSDHQEQAVALLDLLLPDTGKATRVGISGAPGVGKSTFIEALGVQLLGLGHEVAVLAVDPSSSRSGGSILGDKTRMAELARSSEAFIRPSPSGGTLGGVARRTRETMLLCEAFGFDVVLVETVGVGQSETVVDDMVDCFVLLVHPAGGDELQGIKRGVIEVADLVAVTKADGPLTEIAEHARADYTHALHFLRRKHAQWDPRVLLVSAVTGVGIPEVWTTLMEHQKELSSDGELERRRAEQACAWLWNEVRQGLLDRLLTKAEIANVATEIEQAVAEGRTTPPSGATAILAAFENRHD